MYLRTPPQRLVGRDPLKILLAVALMAVPLVGSALTAAAQAVPSVRCQADRPVRPAP